MNNIPREPSGEPSPGGIKNRRVILVSIALVAVVLLVAEWNKSKAVDGFSIVVNQDGTVNLDDGAVTLPASETERLKPGLEIIRDALENPDLAYEDPDRPRKETLTSVIIISKGSLMKRTCGWEGQEWVCRKKTYDF